MQQALLCGDQRPLTVDGDRAALQDEVAGVDPLLPQVLEHPGAELEVGVVGRELLAPGVEPEVHAGAAGPAHHEDGARVARPRVVERDRHDVHVAAHRGARLGLLARVDCERDGLEGGDRVHDRGVLLLGGREALAPHRLARRPADDGALVRRPLRRHPRRGAHFARSLRVRERSSWRSITLWISFRISTGPVAFTWPDSNASRQWRILPSLASSLKCERGTERRTFASEAMSRVIFGPGTCTRKSWMSPRPRSSSSTTSLSFWSAGTSFWIVATASLMSALVSAVDIRRAILSAAVRAARRVSRDACGDPSGGGGLRPRPGRNGLRGDG